MTGPQATVTRERAIGAAVAIAEAHAIRVEHPIVLRDRSNLLVQLAPAPIVARVAAATATMRRGTAWLSREVAVADYLTRAGAPVVAPSALLPPGPHERDGFAMSFWELVEDAQVGLDAREAGRRLRDCHEALLGYDGELPIMGALEEVAGVLARLEARSVIDSRGVARLREVGAELEPRIAALDLPLQPLHGDAGLGNVLSTRDGPRWNDWEDTFRGPVAWDIACLQAAAPPFGTRDPTLVAEALRGYGADVDPEAVRVLVDARRYQATVWGIAIAVTHPDPAERVAERLRWYGPAPG